MSYFGSTSGRSARGTGSTSSRVVSGTTEYQKDNDLWKNDPDHISMDKDSKQQTWKMGLISALVALTAGVGTGALPALFSKLGSGAGLLGLFGKNRSTQSDADKQAIDYLNSLGAGITGDGQSARSNNSNSFMSWITNLLSGSGSGSYSSGGLLPGLLGIGSDYASSLFNYSNMEKLIDKQNSYNTPSAQMQRFADAGLNPNLVYGLGSNGNQPASGSIAPVDFATAQRENRLAKMQIQTQTKMAEADIAQKMSQANLNQQQANYVNSQQAYQQLVNNNYLHSLETQLNEIMARTDNLRTEKRELEARANMAENKEMYNKDIERLEKEIKENEKAISDKQKEYSEANELTSVIGNILGVHLGFGVNYGRSSVRNLK